MQMRVKQCLPSLKSICARAAGGTAEKHAPFRPGPRPPGIRRHLLFKYNFSKSVLSFICFSRIIYCYFDLVSFRDISVAKPRRFVLYSTKSKSKRRCSVGCVRAFVVAVLMSPYIFCAHLSKIRYQYRVDCGKLYWNWNCIFYKPSNRVSWIHFLLNI